MTLPRAREASLRAAAGVVLRTTAIVWNSKPKPPCSTKATRSRGGEPVEHNLQGETDGVGESDIVGRIVDGLPGLEVIYGDGVA